MLGVGNLEFQLKSMTGNVFNMVLFDKLKTGDPIFDAILTTFTLSCLTFLFQLLNKVGSKPNWTWVVVEIRWK